MCELVFTPGQSTGLSIYRVIFISSSLEDVLSSPMDHTPTRSIPATSLQPSAVGSPSRAQDDA